MLMCIYIYLRVYMLFVCLYKHTHILRYIFQVFFPFFVSAVVALGGKMATRSSWRENLIFTVKKSRNDNVQFLVGDCCVYNFQRFLLDLCV